MSSELERRINKPEQTTQTELPAFNNNPSPAPMTLYDALKIGYTRNENKQAIELQKYGFNIDKDLTNYDHLTAYNPKTKKLLYVVNGTDPTRPADILTDINLAFGNIKKTQRYKSDKKAYDKAKQKYNENRTIIAGHSLGGNIASKLDTGINTDILTFNPASTFGEKINTREKTYRTSRDVVSILKPENNVTRVKQKTRGLPILAPHAVSNIKGKKIII